MEWFILSLVSAFFTATSQMLIKRYVKSVNEFVLSSGAIFVAAIILGAISFAQGLPDIESPFYHAVLITGLLNVLATTLQYKALKSSDLSLAMPMLAFTPIFLILTSYVILGELPTYAGMIGIMLIVCGSYVLAATPKMKPLDPFRKLLSNPGMLAILSVSFIYSITSNFDKKVVLSSDVYFGAAASYLIISCSLFAIARIKKQPIVEYNKNKMSFMLIGTVMAIATIAANTALTLQIVPYVIAIKRLSTIFVVIYGIVLFKESCGKQRFIGASVMLLGVLAILLL